MTDNAAPQQQQFSLFEDENAPTMAAELAGWWNGFAVPRATAQTVIDYWNACRANDPNGEWHALPIVDARGHLRIPSQNDPEDRNEDYICVPNADGTFDVDGLVWSVVENRERAVSSARTFTMGLPVDVTIHHDGAVHLTVYAADLVGNLEDNNATAADVALAGRALTAGTLTNSVSVR